VRPVLVALGALLLTSCAGASGDDGTTRPEPQVTTTVTDPEEAVADHAGHDMPVAPAADLGVPDRGFAGPQGRVAQFVVECEFSHALPDDPIVYPGEPGASHVHVFFGNTTVTGDSTAAELLDDPTTCDNPLDTASYWAPALLREGRMIEPVKSTAYYRPGPDVVPASVQPFPPGLLMIAGDPFATEPQPLAVAAWTCGTGAEREPEPPECPSSRDARMLITFPDCWDGENLDSEGHRAHVRYSTGGACPDSHPVPVPQLTFSVQYPVTGPTDGLSLTSGGLYSGHADFVNSWDQATLEQEVALCLNRDLVCSITSGRLTG
jgi:hypothetical protein